MSDQLSPLSPVQQLLRRCGIASTVVILVGVLSACSGDPTDPYLENVCESDADCGDVLYCAGAPTEICTLRCRNDHDCALAGSPPEVICGREQETASGHC